MAAAASTTTIRHLRARCTVPSTSAARHRASFGTSFPRSAAADVDDSPATPSASTIKKPLDKSRYILQEDRAVFPRGFKAAALSSGIKKKAGALDLALVASTTPEAASAAACFTRNVFQAAPVQVSRSILINGGGRARSLIVNSGCANAVTGKRGLEDAWQTSRQVDQLLMSPSSEDGCAAEQQQLQRMSVEKEFGSTLVMSTGVIGQLLPMDKINSSLPRLPERLSDSYKAWSDASKAFMTTDTFPKLRTRSITLPGKDQREIRFVGIDKGAGMIHPNMGPPHATLLGMIATDAAIDPRALQSALTYAIDRSFNSISVDGDMSTNDTVVALANGASGNKRITSERSPEFESFRHELTDFATELASLVVRDGEGATKFIKIRVSGAPNYEDAHHIASVIARSPLVKTAMNGEDANWGRILCAVGYSQPLGFKVDPARVSVSFVGTRRKNGESEEETLRTLVRGEPQEVDEERASAMLSEEDIEIRVDLEQGDHSAAYFTCDFSDEYCHINGSYRS